MPRPKMIAVVPTMITLGNAACGFGAITLAAKVGPTALEGQHLLVAAELIFLAMVFDMLDGSAARLTNQTSELGAQLDSLCDAISFGVAPAFLMLKFWQHDYQLIGGTAHEVPWQYHPRLLWTIAALYVLCAVMRLARFNVETEEEDSHESFSGLPSPAAAGTVAAFPIAIPGIQDLASPEATIRSQALAAYLLPALQVILPLVTLGVACLMVSRIRYPHLFNQWFRGQQSRRHVIQLVFAAGVIYWIHELAVPLIFCYFALSGPIRAATSELSGTRKRKLTPSS